LFKDAKKKYEKDVREKEKQIEALAKERTVIKHHLHSREREATSLEAHLEAAKRSLR
jgi:hypothetical protein